MANLTETSNWDAGVNQLADTTDALNATTLNAAPQALTNRTLWLKNLLTGNYTITDSTVPSSNVGTITALFSGLGNRIKAITGKSSWTTTPATTLEASAAHIASPNPHVGHVNHALATATYDMLVASGPGAFVKKTLAEIKAILGLGDAAYKSTGATSGTVAAGDHGHTNTSNIGGPYVTATALRLVSGFVASNGALSVTGVNLDTADTWSVAKVATGTYRFSGFARWPSIFVMPTISTTLRATTPTWDNGSHTYSVDVLFADGATNLWDVAFSFLVIS